MALCLSRGWQARGIREKAAVFPATHHQEEEEEEEEEPVSTAFIYLSLDRYIKTVKAMTFSSDVPTTNASRAAASPPAPPHPPLAAGEQRVLLAL